MQDLVGPGRLSPPCGVLRLVLASLLLAALLLLLLQLTAPLVLGLLRACAVPRYTLDPSILVNATSLLLVEWMSDKDDDVLPAGVVRVRERFVPGHTRAHAELCGARGTRTRLVVLVASAPAHAEKRMAVRLTWGQAARRTDVALGFVLGAPPAALRTKLDAEDALHGDLIEGLYVDSFGNLTLKTLSMFEWFVSYCPQAARLLKTDDDVFINIESLLRFTEAPKRRHANHTVWGSRWPRGEPMRWNRSKYFVPPEEFPGDEYPMYVGGTAYIVSGDAVRPLLRAALRARWLRMEDVLVTGVAAEAAGVRREASPPVLLLEQVVDACSLRAAFAVFNMNFKRQFDLWDALQDSTGKMCSPVWYYYK